MATLTMSHRETWIEIGISKAKFYELKATGIFDRLESPIPFRYSRAKVEAWIDSRPISHRAWLAAS